MNILKYRGSTNVTLPLVFDPEPSFQNCGVCPGARNKNGEPNWASTIWKLFDLEGGGLKRTEHFNEDEQQQIIVGYEALVDVKHITKIIERIQPAQTPIKMVDGIHTVEIVVSERILTSLAVIYTLCKNQHDGQTGLLITDGHENVFAVKDVWENIRLIYVVYDGNSWSVHTNIGRWIWAPDIYAGRVFFLKSNEPKFI